MRTPTTTQLLSYFNGLGIGITTIYDGSESSVGYKLDENSPFGEKTFVSAQSLWQEWVGYASFRIHERAKFRFFINEWRASDRDERQQLRAALNHYIQKDQLGKGKSNALFDRFAKLPAHSINSMPKNWKRQIQAILASDDLRSFPTRAHAAMDRIERIEDEKFNGRKTYRQKRSDDDKPSHTDRTFGSSSTHTASPSSNQT